MSNDPAYASPSIAVPRRRTSAAAVASLILGLLLCIPVLPGLLAVLLAIIGLRATRDPAIGGRGLAKAGLILGIVGVLLWVGGVGGFVSLILSGSRQPRAVLHDFAHNLTTGNLAAASAESDSSITPADLADLQGKLAALGTYSDLTCHGVNMRTNNGDAFCDLSGTASFSSGSHAFDASLYRDAFGAWKIRIFHIY